MNLSLPSQSIELSVEERGYLKRLRSLLALFGLYTFALVAISFLSDGADIGCILAGIAGHVLYATARTARAWREATLIEDARIRLWNRQYGHL